MVPGSPGKAEQGGGRSSRSRGSARSERRRAIQTALAAINFRAADTHRGCKKFFGLTFPTGRPIRDGGVPARLPARRPMAARRSASPRARPPPLRPPPPRGHVSGLTHAATAAAAAGGRRSGRTGQGKPPLAAALRACRPAGPAALRPPPLPRRPLTVTGSRGLREGPRHPPADSGRQRRPDGAARWGLAEQRAGGMGVGAAASPPQSAVGAVGSN